MPIDSALSVYNFVGKMFNTFVPLKMSAFIYHVRLCLFKEMKK